MNPKTGTMPEEAYDALVDRIYRSQPVAKGSPYLGLSVWMLDD